MVFDSFDARFPGAIGAAEIIFLRLDAVPDNPAPAICAHRREFMNGAFKTIENVAVSRRNNLKRQIIIVSANFTLCHLSLLLLKKAKSER
jgi:hypothetical protein